MAVIITKTAERWRPIVIRELQRAGVPLPVELILSIIDVESSGFPGLKNKSSGASGLMQVMPIVVEDYNKNNSDKYTIEDMRDSSRPTSQIRVGIWILSRFWKSAHKYLSSRMPEVPVDELMKIADLFYVAGPKPVKSRLDKLPIPSYSQLEQNHPEWNALPHTRRVLDRIGNAKFDLAKISEWLSSDKIPTPQQGLALGLAAIAAMWLWLKGKKNAT